MIMGTKNIYQLVNEYLAKWDPIGLPQEIADVEYVDYVPGIVEALSNKKDLCSCLVLFLSKLGIEPILEKDNATQPGFKCWLYETTPEFLKAFPQIANEGVD